MGKLADLIGVDAQDSDRTGRLGTSGTSMLEGALINLSAVSDTAVEIESALVTWVKRARTLGATWAQIGQALGTTRQSAWQRFSSDS